MPPFLILNTIQAFIIHYPLSSMKSIANIGKKALSRKARIKAAETKVETIHKLPVKFIQPNLPQANVKLTSAMRKELSKELSYFKPDFQQVTADKVMSEIDTSLESFFLKRDFTLENFNLLLQLLSQNAKIDEALGAVEKMKILGIIPNLSTYIHLITASGRAKDYQTAELVFNKAKRDLNDTPAALYSALISSYVLKGDHDTILRLINEKRDKGFEHNTVDYTCYINSLVKAGKAEEALEVYKKITPLIQTDEYLLAMVIHACTKTNDAEYALRIWNQLKQIGFAQVPYFYNEIIMALAKRKDYAEKAIEMYKEMRGELIVPDGRTFNGVLTACARLGDLPEARLMLYEMKGYNIEMDETKYSLLMSVYSSACQDANEDAKDLFIKEAWELFRACQEKGWVSSLTLNSLLSVHTSAFLDRQVEGLVLPLFTQFNIKKDKFTYRHLFTMYKDLCEYKTINALWDNLKKENVLPDMYILNTYLWNTLKTNDSDRCVECLDKFKELNYTPLYMYLKMMHKAEELPLRVWAAVQQFEYWDSSRFNRMYSDRLRLDKWSKID